MQINVLGYLKKTLLKRGDKTAIIDGDIIYTFGDLEKYSRKIASLIIKRKDVFKCPVAVYLPSKSAMLISFLGILYSGNFYVPLDTKLPGEKIKSIINNLEPLFIITSKENKEKVEALQVMKDDIILIEDAFVELPENSDEIIQKRLDTLIDSDPLYIMYTSGSTGDPKGVVITHKSVINYIDWAVNCFGIDENTIIGNQAPFYFDISSQDIYLCLAAGASLVIIPEEFFIFPPKLLEYIAKQKVNFICWVPSVVINIANMKLLESIDINCLKKITVLGEVMPTKHFNYWRKYIPGAMYVNLYGPTEATIACTHYILDREFNDKEPLPIGKKCHNYDILILNEEKKLTKKNEIGELCVRGISLAAGYWNNTEKTKAAFVQNPLNDRYPEIIYKTGDLVYLNENDEIMFVGRKDSQIKHMGYRIELGEIEIAVSSLKEIDHACVLYNNEKREITLFYIAGNELNPGLIRKNLLQLLPKYMLPKVFKRLEKFPLNKNGKIDRKKLGKDFFIN